MTPERKALQTAYANWNADPGTDLRKTIEAGEALYFAAVLLIEEADDIVRKLLERSDARGLLGTVVRERAEAFLAGAGV